MNSETQPKPTASLTDYLASERTFLAWIRTGLTLMGFGFVVARFGIFLQEFQTIERIQAAHQFRLSLTFGVALIAIGVAVNLYGAWSHARLVRNLNKGITSYSRTSSHAVILAVVLALVGLLTAIYLISARGPVRRRANAATERTTMNVNDNGLVSVPSAHTVDETVSKLMAILEAKGVTLFARIDHSGEAAKVGLEMRPTKLLIFGSPTAGTPLMLASPTSAIDLPLKLLVSQDADGKVWITYNSPSYLQWRHGLPADLIVNVAVVEKLASAAAS